MTRKQRRIVLIVSGVGVLAVAVLLVLGTLKDSIVFLNSPSDVVDKARPARRPHPPGRPWWSPAACRAAGIPLSIRFR